MKKLNKYLLLLAAAVFTLTACEKPAERESSPEAPVASVSFTNGGEAYELNMQKEALEHTIKLYRTTNIDQADEVKLKVISTNDVFEFDPVVKFKAGEKEVALVVKFPNGESDSTYTLELAIPEDKINPYHTGASSYAYIVSLVNWTDPKQGVFVDYSLGSVFGYGPIAFYADYKYDLKKDGSFKLRVIDPFYVVQDGTEAPDENGVLPHFPYNAAADLLKADNYSLDIFVDKDGKASFQDFALGIDWGYGSITINNFNVEAEGAGVFDDFVAFDPNSKQLVTAMGGDAYAYAGFEFFFSVDAFKNAYGAAPARAKAPRAAKANRSF